MAKLKARDLDDPDPHEPLCPRGTTAYGRRRWPLRLSVPVMIAAGYDAVTGAAIILLGAGIGTLGSTINPFATVIASNAAGVAFTDGLPLRLVILLGGLAIAITYVMRYAARVRRDPSQSRVADLAADHRAAFAGSANGVDATLTATQSVVLIVFALNLCARSGVCPRRGWCGYTDGLAVHRRRAVAGRRRPAEEAADRAFIDGARDLLAAPADRRRGIVVVMEQVDRRHHLESPPTRWRACRTAITLLPNIQVG